MVTGQGLLGNGPLFPSGHITAREPAASLIHSSNLVS
jgi:hypothetical protein